MQSKPTKPAALARLSPTEAAEALRAKRALPIDRLLIADRPYRRTIAAAGIAAGPLGTLPKPPPEAVRVVVLVTRRQRFVAAFRRLLARFVGRLFRSTSTRYGGGP